MQRFMQIDEWQGFSLPFVFICVLLDLNVEHAILFVKRDVCICVATIN